MEPVREVGKKGGIDVESIPPRKRHKEKRVEQVGLNVLAKAAESNSKELVIPAKFSHLTTSNIEYPQGITYIGTVNNGVISGYGRFLLPSKEVYEGEVDDNQFDGHGEMTYGEEGPYKRYAGEWKSGNWSGEGILEYKNGDVFIGHTKDSQTLRGDVTFANHDVLKSYSGDFPNDQMTGVGELIFQNGDRYKGHLVNGVMEGPGEYFVHDGTHSVGRWHNDEMIQGKTDYSKVEGSMYVTYEGPFKNDHFDGKGRLTFKNGDVYDGTFLEGQMHGAGHYIFVIGGYYVGPFANNMANGEGRKQYPNGDSYTGEWKDDKRHGKGILGTGKNSKFTAVWENDELMDGEGQWYTPAGLYTGSMKKGKPYTGTGVYEYVEEIAVGTWNEGVFNGITARACKVYENDKVVHERK